MSCDRYHDAFCSDMTFNAVFQNWVLVDEIFCRALPKESVESRLNHFSNFVIPQAPLSVSAAECRISNLIMILRLNHRTRRVLFVHLPSSNDWRQTYFATHHVFCIHEIVHGIKPCCCQRWYYTSCHTSNTFAPNCSGRKPHWNIPTTKKSSFVFECVLKNHKRLLD